MAAFDRRCGNGGTPSQSASPPAPPEGEPRARRRLTGVGGKRDGQSLPLEGKVPPEGGRMRWKRGLIEPALQKWGYGDTSSVSFADSCTLRYDCHRQSWLFLIRCAEHHPQGEALGAAASAGLHCLFNFQLSTFHLFPPPSRNARIFLAAMLHCAQWYKKIPGRPGIFGISICEKKKNRIDKSGVID